MAGIYIHIPFCRKACHYCNFHFSVSTKYISEIVDGICKEAEIRKEYLKENIATIYFGGGTPSLLSADHLQLIMDKLRELFMINDDAEITLEANPDDINEEKLAIWQKVGINRLSIGLQSFFDEDLVWMNRAHDASQALQSVRLAQQIGFNNISIDLIYGIPTLSNEKWQSNMQQAFDLNVPHLSCYALTVEPKTALHKMIEQHKKENIDPEKQNRHFEMLMHSTQAVGYEHYEISNFAKPGFRSRHNSSYWQGMHYLGLGPSAHSFNGTARQWNISSNTIYLQNIQHNILPSEQELLSETQQLNEYIMTSLRTIEGLSIQHIQEKWGNEIAENILNDSKKWMGDKTTLENNTLHLTGKGKLFCDGIASDLFR